jgi:hypothetical protein
MSPIAFVAFLVLLAVAFAVQLKRATYLRQLREQFDRDPEWRERVKATPWRDRWRISRAVRNGRRLDNPSEARLAVGMAERQLLVMAAVRRPKLRLVLGPALIVLGALSGMVTIAGIGILLTLIELLELARGRRVMERLSEAERANREQTSLQ